MGGDHRCSVCQATFTRPQHVARHMRSHTGDRPYKCQFCGDQFARSDLLSRHVNKCHPSERPPQVAGTTRRKGSASLSRATTSKQSCDQCVQASIPCDGCNPCAKCVHKKCRCTYVKFHRQTAPVGPGHDPRPSPTRVVYPQGNEFATLNIPSITGDLYHRRVDLAHNSVRAGPEPLSSTTTSPMLDADLSARYRTQSDFVSRNSMPFPANNTQSISGQLLYGDPQQASAWAVWSQNSLDGFNVVPDDSRIRQNPMARYLLDDNNNSHLSLSRPFTAAEDPTAFSSQKVGSHTALFSMHSVNGAHIRRGSNDRGSNSSSAASSSGHLPRDMPPLTQQQVAYQELSQDVSLQDYSPVTQSQNHSSHLNHRPISTTAPEGFSSAFGLLSLDDANVLAGLSNDGVPFFTGASVNLFPNNANATPTSFKNVAVAGTQGSNATHNQVPTSTTTGTPRELETRELREFWKAYMRTPLSDTGVFAFDASALISQNQTPSSNGPRRARVSSLPSVKTPTVEMHQSQFAAKEGGVVNGTDATSCIRTTLHGGGEDLRSYEAAVLARRAPVNLNLDPRKARGESSRSPRPQYDQPAAKITTLDESSSGQSTSSLANVFGEEGYGTHVTERQRDRPFHGSTFEQDMSRPSFKRLASQTLGPESSKRAQLSHDEEDGEDEEEDVDSDMSKSPMIIGGSVQTGKISDGDTGLHSPGTSVDRRRRMSAPVMGPLLELVKGSRVM